jgi:hypothetical protein
MGTLTICITGQLYWISQHERDFLTLYAASRVTLGGLLDPCSSNMALFTHIQSLKYAVLKFV